MDIKSGQGFPAGTLSNFTPHPFVIDGVECASMEGFLQSLKFKDQEMQKFICTLSGRIAKSKGSKKNWKRKQVLYWKGKEIARKSDEYQQLLDRAFEALARNESFKKALLATQNATLKHSIGRTKQSETVLTVTEFCGRLTRIRTELQHGGLQWTNDE